MADENPEAVPISQAVAELQGTTPPPVEAPQAPPAPPVAPPAPGEPALTDGPEVMQQEAQPIVAPPAPLAPAEQSMFDQLMTKYRQGGRTEVEARELLAQGVYGNQNQMAQLTNAVGELQQTLQARDEPEVSSPRLDRVDNELAALTARITQNQQQQSQSLLNINTLEKDIAKAEGRAEASADEYDRSLANDQVRTLRDRHAREGDNWRRLRNETDDAARRQESLGYERDEALGEIEQQQQLNQRQEVEAAQNRELTMQEFNAATSAAAEAFQIPQENIQHLQNTIRAEVITYLRSLPDNAPPINIPAFVEQSAQRYKGAMDAAARASFGQFSQQKAGTVVPGRIPAPVPVTPQGSPAAPVSPTQGDQAWTAEQARNRARNILG